MRIIFVVFAVLIIVHEGKAQEADPVTWRYTVKQTGPKIYQVYFIANVASGWHIYAQEQPKEAVAAPTAIRISKNPLLVIKGGPVELGKKTKQFVEELGITQYYYADKVQFVQTVMTKNNATTSLTGTLSYMACTDTRCLPEKTIPFTVRISGE